MIDPTDLLDEMDRRMAEKLEQLEKYIASGVCEDFADYKLLIGRIQIVKEVQADLEELRRQYEEM